MPNYFKQELNLITFFEYYNNITSYQFFDIIEIESNDYSKEIKKDINQEFLNYLNKNEYSIKANKQSVCNNYSHPYDYIIVDNESLEKFCRYYNVFTWDVLDFAYYIDMPENLKFDFIYTTIRSVNFNLIIKLKKESRDLSAYPINLDELESNLMSTEDYEYNDIKF
jgi:protein-tyrosine-phosphatase